MTDWDKAYLQLEKTEPQVPPKRGMEDWTGYVVGAILAVAVWGSYFAYLWSGL
jgi:hypothetical protein